MALTPSNMLPLGTKAPNFTLPDTISGQQLTLNENLGNTATVIFFICNHCPYVHHINEALVKLVNDYTNKGVSFIGISSNDVENYPQDGPEQMKKVASTLGYAFPYLYDASQQVAKDYDAACTPDFYIFDKESTLVYRGQFDNSRPSNGIECDGSDLRRVLENLSNNKAITGTQKPSIGCNIKWKR